MSEQFDGAAEMLAKFIARDLGCIVIVQRSVDAGHSFHVLENGTNIMAYDNDGAIAVDYVEHLVHLFLKTLVDIGVWFV